MQTGRDYSQQKTGSDFKMLIKNTRDMKEQWRKMNVLIVKKKEKPSRTKHPG